MSSRIARGVWIGLGIAGALVLSSLALVYGVSEWRMRRLYDAPLLPLRAALPPDPVAGMHMAKVVGCWAGCHGPEGEGGVERIEGIAVSRRRPFRECCRTTAMRNWHGSSASA